MNPKIMIFLILLAIILNFHRLKEKFIMRMMKIQKHLRRFIKQLKELSQIYKIMEVIINNKILMNSSGVIKDHCKNLVKKEIEKVMALSLGKMAGNIMVNGRMEISMEWEFKHGKTEKIILVIFIKTKEVVLVYCNGPMAKHIKAIGKLVSNMVLASAKQQPEI